MNRTDETTVNQFAATIATEIWRAGALLDQLERNSVKRNAKRIMQQLIAHTIASKLSYEYPDFDRITFLKACGI